MSYKYFNVQNEHTKRKYQVRRVKEPYWKCDNPECKKGGNIGSDTWLKNQTIVNTISSNEKILGSNCVEETIVKVKTKLLSKEDCADCPHCKTGKIRFIGYKIIVDDITEIKVSDVGLFQFQQGTKFIEFSFVPKLSEVKTRFWAKVNEYKTRKYL